MISAVNKKECPKCGMVFDCLDHQCWCGDYPPVLPIIEGLGCFCESCMKDRIAIEIDHFMEGLTQLKIKQVQALGKPLKLKEGIDYQINQSGAWVFSAWYLLRQGSCCGNGCLNCPYKIEVT